MIEKNKNKCCSNGGSEIFIQIDAINFQKNEDDFNCDENSIKSIISNGKAKIIKRKNNKTKLSNTYSISNITNENIDLKANYNDTCCTNKVNEKCLIF